MLKALVWMTVNCEIADGLHNFIRHHDDYETYYRILHGVFGSLPLTGIVLGCNPFDSSDHENESCDCSRNGYENIVDQTDYGGSNPFVKIPAIQLGING